MKGFSYQLVAPFSAAVIFSVSSATASPLSLNDDNRYRSFDEIFSESAFGGSDFFMHGFAERVLGRHSSFGLLKPNSRSTVRNYVIDQQADEDSMSNSTVTQSYVPFDLGLFGSSGVASSPSGSKVSLTSLASAVGPTDLFWSTNGTSATWTAANWGTITTGPFSTAYTANKNAEFTANSLVTFATVSIGDVKVDAGVTVTVTAAGTLSTNGSVRTFDIGTGGFLTWTGQTVSNNSSSGFIKDGAGTWNIGSQANAYTGGFTLNAGTVIVTGAKSFGTAAMTINGGTVQSSTSITFALTSLTIGGNFSFSGSGTDVWGMTTGIGSSTRQITNATTTSGAIRTLSGNISGSAGAGLTFLGSGAANSNIVLSGTNDYTGATTVSAGTITAASNSAFGSSTASTAGLVMNPSSGTATVNFTSAAPAIASLSSSGAGTSNVVLGNSGGTPSATTLTVGGNNASTTFAGVISDKTGTAAAATGALAKTGTGVLTLGGPNSYTGATNVNAGTLLVNNTSGSGTGTGSVSVNNTGTLGGSGKISGAVNVASGGTLSPGNSPGTLYTGALTLATGSTYLADVNGGSGPTGTGAGTLYDQTVVTGPLTINGALSLAMGATPLALGDKFFIFTYTGPETGAFSNATGTGGTTYTQGADTFLVNYADTFSGTPAVSLTLTEVPEPSTWAAGILAVCAVGYTQRKRFAKRSAR
ncbi:MAG: beta strand repeat-containing protein [Chthoniobacterales bacterium]